MVKLAEVVEVVDVVAVGLVAAGGLAGRREPDVVDADGLEGVELGPQALPVGAVGGDVPLEALEEAVVFLFRG